MNCDLDLKKEAAWAICNAVTGSTAEQIWQLVHFNALHALCALMKQQSSQVSADLLLVLLQSLTRILECGEQHFNEGGVNLFVEVVEEAGGLQVLENLQRHPNSVVYEMALGLLEGFFELETDESDELVRAIKECSQFSF
jgi:hypothetical protein